MCKTNFESEKDSSLNSSQTTITTASLPRSFTDNNLDEDQPRPKKVSYRSRKDLAPQIL